MQVLTSLTCLIYPIASQRLSPALNLPLASHGSSMKMKYWPKSTISMKFRYETPTTAASFVQSALVYLTNPSPSHKSSLTQWGQVSGSGRWLYMNATPPRPRELQNLPPIRIVQTLAPRSPLTSHSITSYPVYRMRRHRQWVTSNHSSSRGPSRQRIAKLKVWWAWSVVLSGCSKSYKLRRTGWTRCPQLLRRRKKSVTQC